MQQPAPAAGPVNLVELEGQQGTVIGESVISPEAPLSPETMPAAQQAPGAEQNVIEESLEELKEEYDDAKLNSIIIEQVKELIEIDNNLNNKIDDLRVDLKKEIENREKLEQQISDHYHEQKELEKSIEKFIALYEVVTNQFNPFVRQDGAQDLPNFTQKAPEQKKSPLHDETDVHFVTKSGKRIKSLHELIGLLEQMPDDEFQHHVTMHKNDFSAWVHQALGKEDVASKIAPLRDKAAMISALKSFETPTQ